MRSSTISVDKRKLDQALATIRKRTSRSAVKAYLREKNVPFSAKNWDLLIENRIKPALEKGLLADNDIRELLREAEDFGHQHVFLFEPSSKNNKPEALIKVSLIEQKLKKVGLSSVVDSVKIVGMPAKPEIVDIHYDTDYLSIKVVEPRLIILEEREAQDDGSTLLRKVRKKVRAVSVVKAFQSGLMEFRVGTYDGTPDYSAVVEKLWRLIEEILPRNMFREKELLRVRRKFTVNPSDTVKSIVRIRMTKGEDGGGVRYSFIAGRPADDILNHANVVEGIGSIAGSRKSRPGTTSVGFTKQADGFPSRELGVSFLDNVNEYIVRLNCTRREHEYIQSKIEKYS